MPIHRRDFLSATAAVAGLAMTGVHAYGAASKKAAAPAAPAAQRKPKPRKAASR